MIKPFLLSTIITLDGKQIHASFRGITLTMVPIVKLKCSLKLTLILQLKKIQKKTNPNIIPLIKSNNWLKTLNQNSVTILLNSKQLLKKCNHGQRNIQKQMISRSLISQSLITSQISMVSISLEKFVIRVPVDLATLSLSLKSLNQDSK
jgi:hypothetical protein